MSEMSWDRVANPYDVVAIGQEVDVKVPSHVDIHGRLSDEIAQSVHHLSWMIMTC